MDYPPIHLKMPRLQKGGRDMGKGLHTIIQEKNKVQLAAWCEQKTGFFYGYPLNSATKQPNNDEKIAVFSPLRHGCAVTLSMEAINVAMFNCHINKRRSRLLNSALRFPAYPQGALPPLRTTSSEPEMQTIFLHSSLVNLFFPFDNTDYLIGVKSEHHHTVGRCRLHTIGCGLPRHRSSVHLRHESYFCCGT